MASILRITDSVLPREESDIVLSYFEIGSVLVKIKTGYPVDIDTIKGDINKMMSAACRGGNLIYADRLIKRGARPETGIIGAYHSGNVELVSFLYGLGANDWKKGVDIACRAGFCDLVRFIFENDLSEPSLCAIKNYQLRVKCVKRAGMSGNITLMRYLLDHGAKCVNNGLYGACYNGQLEMIDFLIERGANRWNQGLVDACLGGQLNAAEVMIKRGATSFNEGLHSACYAGKPRLIDFMIKMGANDWNGGLIGACYDGRLDIIKKMIERGANDVRGALDKAERGVGGARTDAITYLEGLV